MYTLAVTHPVEVRLSALDGVRRVTSTSRDQVSLVQVEFEYGNDITLDIEQVAAALVADNNSCPVVAIGGLIAGTFLTLLVVPVLFHALEHRRWSKTHAG